MWYRRCSLTRLLWNFYPSPAVGGRNSSPASPLIVLPLVHTLNHGAPGLLNFLSLPVLKNLHIPRDLLPPPDELNPFLTRSGCSLRMLHLEAFGAEGVLDFLRTVPFVSEITGEIGELEEYWDDDDEKFVMERVLALLDAFAAGDVLPSVEKMTLLRVPSDIVAALHSTLRRKVQLPTSRLNKLTINGRMGNLVPLSLRLALAEKDVAVVLSYNEDSEGY
ncbi:hypothetical protein C8F01DRAFT_1174216 [Mycena amicta]|nr:hypothetical protein C8F01DRAFT_1174216 [Mycena amicta]